MTIENSNFFIAPILQDGLCFREKIIFDPETSFFCFEASDVLFCDTILMNVNQLGKKLLKMADGEMTIYDMARALDMEELIEEIGMFF